MHTRTHIRVSHYSFIYSLVRTKLLEHTRTLFILYMNTIYLFVLNLIIPSKETINTPPNA